VPVFRCSVVPTGSSSDGTKIGDPDEFDFMFCLEYFSEECIPYQSTVSRTENEFTKYPSVTYFANGWES
jgi:hypothetical protein